MLNYMVRKFTKSNIRTKLTIVGKHNPVLIKLKMAHLNVRWAVNVKAWTPTYEEILAATTYIQQEEKERIDKFIYQDDAKSSLVGRLLMRKYAHLSTGIEEVRFGRDLNNKPYLLGTGEAPVNFNVSHQGDYSVLAGIKSRNIGVDIMKIEAPATKNVQEFFRLMNRQCSHQEWATIRKFPQESQQMACFYRLWSLKEAYLKNIGIGVTVALDKISFSINSFDIKVGQVVTDTQLYVEGVLKEDYLLEETLLDERHTVAVAIHVTKDIAEEPPSFSFLNLKELVKEAKPFSLPDRVFANDFMKKAMKHF